MAQWDVVEFLQSIRVHLFLFFVTIESDSDSIGWAKLNEDYIENNQWEEDMEFMQAYSAFLAH